MRMRLPWIVGLALAALLAAAAAPAEAKHFRPGELKLCNDTICVRIFDRSLLDGLSRFSFLTGGPEVGKPRLGAPLFQIKVDGGYVTGIVATKRLERFRSGGMGTRFGPDDWYRVPPTVASALRKLSAGMQPLRVTQSTVDRTRYG
ncbi:MAG TPA: hypothetical protein VFD90_14500 [Gaiellales bacterium]|nr:hypothetical protein [Gaiellales bacterium]